MTFEDLLAELPDEALVPVGWVRGQLGVSAAVGMTVDEAAERIGRSPSTVRAWCRDGSLPGAYRLRGREWRVPPAALAKMNDRPPDRGNGSAAASLASWRAVTTDDR